VIAADRNPRESARFSNWKTRAGLAARSSRRRPHLRPRLTLPWTGYSGTTSTAAAHRHRQHRSRPADRINGADPGYRWKEDPGCWAPWLLGLLWFMRQSDRGGAERVGAGGRGGGRER